MQKKEQNLKKYIILYNNICTCLLCFKIKFVLLDNTDFVNICLLCRYLFKLLIVLYRNSIKQY